jgi:serine palmitoyltransferase
MDFQEAHTHLLIFVERLSEDFHKLPGSAILLRYIKSSYQNDPIRSAVELFLVLFAVRYLLAPKYSTKPNHVALSEEVRSWSLNGWLWWAWEV